MKQFEVLVNEPKFEPNLDEPGFGKILFEISHGDASQPCSIKVKEDDERLALAFFHSNWPVIGKMAREALIAGELENGEIRLVAPT